MNRISISEIQIIPIKPREGHIGFASCVINDSIFMGSIAVYTSTSTPEGYRLVYPSKKLLNGKELYIFHPICKESGKMISTAIINKFKEIVYKEVNENEKIKSHATNSETMS